VIFSVAVMVAADPAPLGARETPADVIAAHLRLQGYECAVPRSAKRDGRASRPDEAVWIITCAQAKYRVRLVPDQAAVVERID
jgi:hypothetical protein